MKLSNVTILTIVFFFTVLCVCMVVVDVVPGQSTVFEEMMFPIVLGIIGTVIMLTFFSRLNYLSKIVGLILIGFNIIAIAYKFYYIFF